MKRCNTPYLWCILVLSLNFTPTFAQFTCVNSLEVQLDPVGTYTLFPEDLLSEGNLAGYTAIVTPSTLTCEDLGSTSAVLDIYDGGNLIFSCTTALVVEETILPVAVCDNSLHVELDVNGEHTFTLNEIDDGSYDFCGIAEYVIQPQAVHCGDPNPLPVTLTTIDENGNSASCFILVTWESYPNPTSTLACNALIVLTPALGETILVTPFMVLEGGPYGCPDQYEVEISEEGNVRPQPTVTLDDSNKVLLVKITDTMLGGMCWGELTVLPDPSCDPLFTICDTECRTAPLGNCASGHTEEDHVEWPCDILISTDCNGANLYFTPEELVENGHAVIEDAFPQIADTHCYLTGTTYEDQIFYTQGQTRIVRKWSIIYWLTGQIWNYTQEIIIGYTPASICDILPWNTPIGDCDSGHTLSDDVEWPADITVNTLCIYPEDFDMNPDVASEDVRPRLFAECASLSVSYTDVVMAINDTTLQTDRTWLITEVNTGVTWPYIQTITVHSNTTSSLVCTMRETGDPIPGVELIPGIETDTAGCYLFTAPDGIVVTPTKESPLTAGVNLLDKIMIMEYILGIRTFTPYQIHAADLDQNGSVTTLDVLLMDQWLNGTPPPPLPPSWTFFDRATQLGSADISDPLKAYKFIGVKTGDIDNSFTLSAQNPYGEIALHARDEILNHKEEYAIPFSLTENTRMVGFNLRIENPSGILQYAVVEAPLLPGFNMEDHVLIIGNTLYLNWAAPEAYFSNGVPLPAGTPLFVLHFESTANSILSDELSLENGYDHLLKPNGDRPPLKIVFEWEDEIISGLITAGPGHVLEIYPNPVRESLHFKTAASLPEGRVQIMDGLGRMLMESRISPYIDVRHLHTGLYYARMIWPDGTNGVSAFYKN